MAYVRKRSGNWHVYWKVNAGFDSDGKVIWKQRSRKVGRLKGPAEKMAREIEHKLAQGELVGTTSSKVVKFGDFCKLFQELHVDRSARTIEYDQGTIDKHLIPHFGEDRRLDHVSVEQCADFKAKRGSNVAPATVNRELDTLKSMMNRAVEWGYLKESPAASIRKYKVQLVPREWLRPDQIRAVIDTANGLWKTYFATGFYAGPRPGELRLMWQTDYDIPRKVVTIMPDRSKSSDFRQVPMHPELVRILESHPWHSTSRFVFCKSNGEPRSDLRHKFNAVIKEAGVPEITPHGMRHSFISNAIHAGVDLRTVQEWAGHKNIKTTQRYAHVAPEFGQEDIQKLNY